MKLYLLARMGETGYDEFSDHLVRVVNETQARYLANTQTGDEGKIWGDSSLVKCEEVPQDGAEQFIISSFNAG